MFQNILALLLIITSKSKLLPSLDLKPSGWVTFTNETETRTDTNTISFYVNVWDEVQEKQHIISIRSETRSEQFIKVSLIQMQLSVLANLRHPAVSRWFLVGDRFLPNQGYYIKINQNRTYLHITINNKTISGNLGRVEEFIYPAKIAIGNVQTAPGINGSLAGVTYNGVDMLHSYFRRDEDFRNVAVEMGGDVTAKERDWVTIDERNKKYCPHTNHFPKSEVGTEIRISHCQQNIARAVCGENNIWLIEKCVDDNNYEEGNTGMKGEPGAPGLGGPPGSKGPRGRKGASGRDGETGPDGQPGEVGADGADGYHGVDGMDGLKGQKGESGVCEASSCSGAECQGSTERKGWGYLAQTVARSKCEEKR